LISWEGEGRINLLNITYRFIPQGKSYESTEDTTEVVLDVGGLNEKLIFDHHFPGGEDCAALLVFKNCDRLKPLKKDGVQNITIVIHSDPDFDCSCAAWLVTKFLKEDFPAGSEWLARYAAIVDSGKLRVRKEFYLVPASVMYAFHETVNKLALKNRDEKNQWILERAFELMNWCTENLADKVALENDDERIFNLMETCTLFDSEYKLLEEDRSKYDKEIADNNLSLKIDQFKLHNKEINRVENVKALIFNKPSESSLVKHWARADGYILTLIPQLCENQWNDVIWKPRDFTAQPNRVIISVPVETPYTLQPLAIELERAECELERRILGDAAELKRTRTIIRNGYENDVWVTNNDPWYDGSAHCNTIVDSPSSASFLSTERIKTIAMNHTKKDVSTSRVNIVAPIMLTNKKEKSNTPNEFNEVISKNKWNRKNNEKNLGCPKVSEKYLFDYVEKFLNSDGCTKDGAIWYEIKTNNNLFLEKTNELKYSIKTINQNDNTSEIESPLKQIEKIEFVWFNSQIAFLIIGINFGSVMAREISNNLKTLSKSYSDIVDFFIKQGYFKSDGLEFKEPVYSVLAEFNSEKRINLDIGHDVFSTCSFIDKTVPLTDGSNERKIMEKMLLRVNAGTVLGLSRNCFMLASITPSKVTTNNMKKSDLLNEYERKFSDVWLNEWLIVLHQHFFMVAMKTRLGTSDVGKRSSLSRLRSKLVEFTANSCFAQVTSDHTGAELYNRWKKLLTLDDLNREVSTQIQALNDNATSSIQNLLTGVTFIFFPITLLLSILSFFQFVDLTTVTLSNKFLLLAAMLGISITLWVVQLSGIRTKKVAKKS
jgi:hypothetical protein